MRSVQELNEQIEGVLTEAEEIHMIASKNAAFFPVVKIPQGTYQGHMLNDKPHGYGTLNAKDGAVWNLLKIDEDSTKGQVAFEDGTSITGQFKNSMANGPCQKKKEDGECMRGIFNNGEVGEKLAIRYPDGSLFYGFHENSESVWIGGYQDAKGQLSIGEFDFQNTGKPCIQLIPEFLSDEHPYPCPGSESPDQPSTKTQSSQGFVHTNGIMKKWCDSCGMPCIGDTIYCTNCWQHFKNYVKANVNNPSGGLFSRNTGGLFGGVSSSGMFGNHPQQTVYDEEPERKGVPFGSF